MTFLWPTALAFLVAVPVLLGLYVWAQRRRRKYALRYASLSLVKEALGRGPGVKRHIPAALYLLALAFMLTALARPVTVVKVPSQEGIVILAIDVSLSMRATDIKPDRITAAKAASKAFVLKQGENVKIGVVAFASDASIVQPPTTDHDLVLAAIDRLRLQRATAIGRAILTSLDAIAEPQCSRETGKNRGAGRGKGIRVDHPAHRRSEQPIPAAALDHRSGHRSRDPRVHGRGGHTGWRRPQPRGAVDPGVTR